MLFLADNDYNDEEFDTYKVLQLKVDEESLEQIQLANQETIKAIRLSDTCVFVPSFEVKVLSREMSHSVYK